jgi:CheY-like chemotaxis protein
MEQLRPLTILLVEDDEGHATLVRMNLADAGMHNPIEHFANGRSALRYVEREQARAQAKILVVLLDLNLPEIDGFEVLRQLKSNRNTQKIPVIVLTSTDDPKEINRCYEMGCNLFVRKPVDYARFAHAIHQLGSFLSVIELPTAA